MKRLGLVAFAVLVCLGPWACEPNNGDRSKNGDGVSGIGGAHKDSLQQQSSQVAREAWSKGKRLGRKVSNRLDD